MIAVITKYYDDKYTYKVVEGEETKQYEGLNGLIESNDECDVYIDWFETKEQMLDKWNACVDEEAVEEA
jgi:hypothetical protein